VTKDRRLGRGLAALLGTPMEEEGISDGVGALSRQDGSVGGARSPQKVPGSVAASASALVAEADPDEIPSKTMHPTKGVTGSVPLETPPPSPAADKPQSATTGRPKTNTFELSVYEVDNNPFQPRRKFNEEEIASLAASIREHQQLQPILVRRVGDRYQLISGERRLRATIHAGLKTIRAEVREADDRLVAELAIVENLQRKDLDAIEKAMSFRRYIDQHQCTQEDLAKRLKIDRSTIANLMRLLELPDEIQDWIQSDKLTAGHARSLLPLGDETQQIDFARRIRDESWSVRETERQVAEQLALEDGKPIAGGPPNRGQRKPPKPQLAALEQEMRLALGTKTEIKQSPSGRGKIVISFANAEEFERLYALICPSLQQKAA
jgi:ParB family chromosome partitioning protein